MLHNLESLDIVKMDTKEEEEDRPRPCGRLTQEEILLHITHGIRYAAYSAARGSKNTSRACALCGVFSHPHSSPPANLRFAL